MKKQRLLLAVLILLLMLPCAFALAAKPNIPNNAITFNGHTYALFNQGCTWKAARKKCEKAGGHLVTISNRAENNVVKKLVRSMGLGQDVAWIGLWKPSQDSSWRWVTGEAVNFTYFPEGITDYGYVYMEGFAEPLMSYEAGMWHVAPPQESVYDELIWSYVCEWDFILVSAPKNVKASQPSANTVKLTWSKSTNANKYVILRKGSSSTGYMKVGETKKCTFTDKEIKNGKAYKYKVQAVNGDKTATSSAVSAYPMAKPTSVKVKSAEGKKVTVSWKKVSGAKKYLVYWKGPDDTEYKQIKSVKTTKTTIAMPEASGTYKFLVRPAVGSFIGIPSKAASFKYENTVYRAIILVFSYFGTDAYLSSAGSMSSGMVNTLKNLDATPYQITSLFDPSVDEIKAAFCNVFGQADSDDVTLLYIYGHGLEGATNPADHGAILIAHGTENNVGLHPEEFRAELDKYQGKKVILLETCYSGVMIGKGKSASTKREKVLKAQTSFINAFRGSNRGDHDLAGPGYYVLTASNGEQESWYHFFTTYLMNGLGWENSAKTQLYADSNGDHKVTFNEIYKYVRKQVDQEWAEAMAEVQTVQVYPENCQIAFFGRTE